MANTKISQLTANTNPNGGEELVYAYNNANGKMTLDTMKTYATSGKQDTLVSGTNIKTINNNSILGSGNLVISGGGSAITTLNADANIWELSDGIYETEYDLYYQSGLALERGSGAGLQFKQMISVVEGAGGSRGYLAFNGYDKSTIHRGRAFFGYSLSSSNGVCNELGSKDWALNIYQPASSSASIDAFETDLLVQNVSNISDGINDLRISTSNPPYPGITYTIYIDSVASGKTYTITLGSGITNPFNITLPTNSNKKCLITCLMTSSTTGIVTGCTIAS